MYPKLSGDDGGVDPPVPIPNTEVKHTSAEGTWGATPWENRTLPGSVKSLSEHLREAFTYDMAIWRFSCFFVIMKESFRKSYQ